MRVKFFLVILHMACKYSFVKAEGKWTNNYIKVMFGLRKFGGKYKENKI